MFSDLLRLPFPAVLRLRASQLNGHLSLNCIRSDQSSHKAIRLVFFLSMMMSGAARML